MIPLWLVLACSPDSQTNTSTTADPTAGWEADADTDTDADTDANTDADTDADTDTDTADAPYIPHDPIRIYAVRHCEKDGGDDPGLTEEGAERAEALAVLMQEVTLDGIYATSYRRTQETVQPTADDQGLTVITDIDPEDDLAAHIRTTHPGQTVLHAGHSFTLEDFSEAIGLADGELNVSGYGQLWIIDVVGDGTFAIEESTFGVIDD